MALYSGERRPTLHYASMANSRGVGGGVFLERLSGCESAMSTCSSTRGEGSLWLGWAPKPECIMVEALGEPDGCAPSPTGVADILDS